MGATVKSFSVFHGDVRDVLPTLPAGSFDACLCDPPYGLGFMGKEWDSPGRSFVERKPVKANAWDHVGGNHNPSNGRDRARTQARENAGLQAWCTEWAVAALPLLKPGAFLLAFGGTRTFHRLACAIEDAGFEIRDSLCWLYGSGFPKSLDVSKAIDKAAGANRPVIGFAADRLRPNREKHLLAGQPGGGGKYRADNGATVTAAATPAAARWSGYGTALKPAWEPVIVAMKPLDGTFAANALVHGVAGLNVDGCRLGTGGTVTRHTRSNGEHRDRWDGNTSTGELTTHAGRWPANVVLDEAAAAMLDEQTGDCSYNHGGVFASGQPAGWSGGANNIGRDGNARREVFGYGDAGGASRFFYTAKADPSERRIGGVDCRHPTLKPIDLTSWLARLILPPERETPRRLLVPFSGAGSEIIGALRAGWDEVVGIEREAEYAELSRRRIAGDAPLLNNETTEVPA